MNIQTGALRAIADKAYKEHTGARGLRTIVCEIANKLLYEQSGKCGARYTITAQNIRENTLPVPTVNSVDVGPYVRNLNEVRRLNELSQQHESKTLKERLTMLTRGTGILRARQEDGHKGTI